MNTPNISQKWRSIIALLSAAALVVVAYALLVGYYNHKYPAGDPDRFFHYAVSKKITENGSFPKSLPQVEDNGWNEFFVNKAFFFHVIGAAGYAVAQEKGADFISYLFGLATFLLLLWRCGRKMGYLDAALLVIALGILNPYFSPRMTLFRAHVPALFFFCVFLIGVFDLRKWLVFIAAFFFTLTYHPFHMLLPPIVLSLAVNGFQVHRNQKRLALKVAGYGLFGIVVGILVNPYFPGNLFGAWDQILIALFYIAPEAGVTNGGELAPLSLRQFLIAFGPDVLLLLLAVAVFFWKMDWRREKQVFAAFVLALLYWVLTIKTPRGSEYSIPATILVVAYVWSKVPLKSLQKTGILALLLLSTAGYLAHMYQKKPNVALLKYHDSIFEALEKIPSTNQHYKILNCDWYFGSFLIYARPDLHFVDALDARTLQFFDPEKFELNRQMKLGNIKQLNKAVQAFKSDYILCDEDILNKQLAADKYFELVYKPEVKTIDGVPFLSPIRLFRLLPEGQ